MKIAYVTMRFPLPSETFACNDVKDLIKKGHEVEVYCLREKHERHDELIVERGLQDVNIHHVSFGSFIPCLIWMLSHPLMFLSLFFWNFSQCITSPKHLLKSLMLIPAACLSFKDIKKKNPDVVHLFWGHYTSLTGYLVDKFLSKKVLTQFLGAHDLITQYPASFDLASRVDVLFSHSHSNIAAIDKILLVPRKVNIVFRGTVIDRSQPSKLDKFNNLSDPVFITACRLIEEKGVFEVLNVFTYVRQRYPSATLKIAGDGPDRIRLENHVKNLGLESYVTFLGHIDQKNLIEYMSDSHFFILLSRYASERLPNVVKEAMFQECVVFTTQTSGIEELIDDAVDGYVITNNKLPMLASYICDAFSDEVFLKDIAHAAREKIIRDFDISSCMDCYVAIWQEQIRLKHF